MVSKVGTFLGKVRETLPLLEEILASSDHIIHKSKAVELAFRIKSVDTLLMLKVVDVKRAKVTGLLRMKCIFFQMFLFRVIPAKGQDIIEKL